MAGSLWFLCMFFFLSHLLWIFFIIEVLSGKEGSEEVFFVHGLKVLDSYYSYNGDPGASAVNILPEKPLPADFH